jgi:hypothetical protein
MKSQEFVIWLKGFMDAIDSIPTQAQWDIIKDKIDNVKEYINVPLGPITRDQTWPSIDPYKITCSTATLPKGTNINYTANLPKELLND